MSKSEEGRFQLVTCYWTLTLTDRIQRCGLEQPSCQRCVKLKKVCSGYRDTTSLQIQDESEAVKLKAERQQHSKAPSPQPAQQPKRHSPPPPPKPQSNFLAPPTITDNALGIPTPGSINSDSTSSSDSTIDLERDTTMLNQSIPFDVFDFATYDPTLDQLETWSPNILLSPEPKPDDIASTYFFHNFTSSEHWSFMRGFVANSALTPCLDFAVKACGMAAFGNVERYSQGMAYARSMYTSALGLLNEQLRDPIRSKTDESLVAVALLGRYENLTCDGLDSIQSWKAHIKGSTQLLNVRGRGQFCTHVGRSMWREMRSQALIHVIWEDQYVPQFFRDYQTELESYPQNVLEKPVDDLTKICFDLADLRANIRLRRITDTSAAHAASQLESRFIQWAIDTEAYHEQWHYSLLDVDDSEHVWDGKVHSYSGFPMPTVWNSYRQMRIMLTRTHEWLCRRIPFSEEERQQQTRYFRNVRRQMTEDICATVPVALGHGSPANTSPCLLLSGYGAIWPLFFAGTCVFERVGPGAWSIVHGEMASREYRVDKPATQAQWIMSRLEYISTHIGVKWADGVVAVLRGDFKVPQHLIDL